MKTIINIQNYIPMVEIGQGSDTQLYYMAGQVHIN